MAVPSASKKFVMEFTLIGGKTMALTITSPKQDLTSSTVQTVMNTIIDKEAFLQGTAYPTSIKDAYYIETTVNQVV